MILDLNTPSLSLINSALLNSADDYETDARTHDDDQSWETSYALRRLAGESLRGRDLVSSDLALIVEALQTASGFLGEHTLADAIERSLG